MILIGFSWEEKELHTFTEDIDHVYLEGKGGSYLYRGYWSCLVERIRGFHTFTEDIDRV